MSQMITVAAVLGGSHAACKGPGGGDIKIVNMSTQ